MNVSLSLLVETQPSAYFTQDEHDDSKLVLSSMWEALVAAKLIDEKQRNGEENSLRRNVVLYQLLDIFDAGTDHGIPSLVLDTLREVQPEAIVDHCGITIAECVLKWVAQTVESCMASLRESFGDAMDSMSLRKTLKRSEAAREAAVYALSWQDMERSFHQIKSAGGSSMVSGPMSQAVVQNLKELSGMAFGISVALKCMLAIAECGAGNVVSEGDAVRLERCRNAEGGLLWGLIQRCGYGRSLNDYTMSPKERAMALLIEYLEGGPEGARDRDLLALFVYHLPEEGVVESLTGHFPECASELQIWALAPLLDEARVVGGDAPLQSALVAISSGRLDCRRMPMAYLLALLELGQSALTLSLLYQKWIDPNVTEDVLGCIQILMHVELVIECYVHIKQYLRQLQETGSHVHASQNTYQNKAKIFWQAMFAAGAERGLLFQLIRLPMAAKEEVYVVDWLRRGDHENQKALCLYYLIRGRTDEASREIRAMGLGGESEWDERLVQLCELANQSKLIVDADIGTDVDSRMPACMLLGDSDEASPGKTSTGGLLFGAPAAQPMDSDAGGHRAGKSTIGAFEATAPAATQAVGVRGRVARSLRDNAKVHQLDRVLGF